MGPLSLLLLAALPGVQVEEEGKAPAPPVLQPQSARGLVPESVLGALEEELQDLYLRLRPYVVQVRMPVAVESPDGVQVQEVLVSGLVLGPGGLVVAPGLAGPGTEGIRILRQDGLEVAARSLARDDELGLTLLSAPELGIPPPPVANCDTVLVGSVVLAVGNGYGLEGSFSLGYVAGKDRALGQATGLLQVTNPVNPGDGGGLLANRRGQVVGVLLTSLREAARRQAARAPAPEYEGMLAASSISFAVPVERVVAAFPRWLARRLPNRPRLGAVVELVLGEEERQAAGLADRPALLRVSRVLEDSPAARAGLRPGDLLLRFGGEDLRSLSCLRRALATCSGPVSLRVLRDGQPVDLVVRLQPLPQGGGGATGEPRR